MNRHLTFTLVTALVFGFSAMVLAQDSTTTTQTKQDSAKTVQKATPAHQHHTNLSKEEIIALQNALIKTGDYKGEANGKLDEATQQAIRHYQKTNKLKETGWPNKKTLDKLGVAYAKPAPQQNTTQAQEKKAEPAPQKPDSTQN